MRVFKSGAGLVRKKDNFIECADVVPKQSVPGTYCRRRVTVQHYNHRTTTCFLDVKTETLLVHFFFNSEILVCEGGR